MSTQGKPHRVPVHSTLIDFSSSSPRPLVKRCLGSHRARPCVALVSFDAKRPEPKIRPADVLQSYISKTNTRCFAWLPSRCPELPPVRPCGQGGSRHRLPASDGASSFVSSVLFSARSGAPFPLTFRHRPAVARFWRASAVRSEAAAPPPNVKCGGGARPRTSSSGKEFFSNPLLFSRAVAFCSARSSARRPFTSRR